MDLARESSYPTPLNNSALLPLLLLSLVRQKHSPDDNEHFNREYDYIVVGSGSAGAVVASRLSEIPCVNVLLLEAGRKPPVITEVPALAGYLWRSDLSWNYKMEPQKYASFGYENGELNLAASKMLGGSSSLNSMVYIRGNKQNYNDWEAMGATNWSYDSVFPYFERLEDNRDPNFLFNGYHGFGGPITVEQPRYSPAIKDVLYEAIDQLGYEILDSNADRQTGFYDHQANIRDGQRCSTAKAYLVPAEERENLDIVADAMVTKVIIEDGEACGVQFDFRGESFQVRSRKEVILSAGAINTPKLLKLSGIGRADELERLNIPVLTELPVGENLQNHPTVSYHFVVDSPIPDFDEKLADEHNIQEYIENRTGPLSSSDGYWFTAFVKGLEILPAEDSPIHSISFTEAPISKIRASGLKPEVYQRVYGPYENRTLFSCTIYLLQPKSTGTVTLRSGDPYDPPIIKPNYLADPDDVEEFVKGMKFCQRVLGTDAFRRIGAVPLQTVIPGCEDYVDDEDEDEYLRCFTRAMLFTFHHQSGTAKMGSPTDRSSVLDPKLRVKDINRLRVVDASVMPTVTSGNTNIPTIMIAEKASDMIKETIDCNY